MGGDIFPHQRGKGRGFASGRGCGHGRKIISKRKGDGFLKKGISEKMKIFFKKHIDIGAKLIYNITEKKGDFGVPAENGGGSPENNEEDIDAKGFIAECVDGGRRVFVRRMSDGRGNDVAAGAGSGGGGRGQNRDLFRFFHAARRLAGLR